MADVQHARRRAQQILHDLAESLLKQDVTEQDHTSRLTELKALARDPARAPSVYSESGLRTLRRCAFRSASTPDLDPQQKQGRERTSASASSLEAARIIANALLLRESLRQTFADLDGAVDDVVSFYSTWNHDNDNDDDDDDEPQQDRHQYDHEFVGGRILFLLTYNTDVDFVQLERSRGLFGEVSRHLARHATRTTTSMNTNADTNAHTSNNTETRAGKKVSSQRDEDPMAGPALVESLKLLFNLITKIPGPDGIAGMARTALIQSIHQVLVGVRIPEMPLDPPIAQVVNVLALAEPQSSSNEERGEEKENEKEEESVDDKPRSEDKGKHEGGERPSALLARLLDILRLSIQCYKPSQLEVQLIPLLTVLRCVYSTATTDTQAELRQCLLPDDTEREKPLGQSSSLASQMLRLSAAAGMTQLSDAIMGLLYELSDSDPQAFVHNIGYGHAAGHLANHRIAVPENVVDAQPDLQDVRSKRQGGETSINPITGQRLDAEAPMTMPTMTQQEKEREAERLFVLLERLKATGVVDIENPVAQAVREGRFEELPDSDPDSEPDN